MTIPPGHLTAGNALQIAMGCLFSVFKTSVIYGAGVYTGVYVAQNYKIDKVEDPSVLFGKAQAYVQSKLGEISDNSKKGDK